MRGISVENFARTARKAAAEGIVLLENKDYCLPLHPGKIALFGRNQFHYYKSGTGSGGMVNTGKVLTIYDALNEEPGVELDIPVRQAYESWIEEHPFDVGQGWAQEPWYQEEMPLNGELVRSAAERCDTAVILIGRTAGEDQDNKAEQGSFFLTAAEEDMLQKVCKIFSRTVVLLNVGNIIDMSWVKKYKPSAVAYLWQGGQEGAKSAADVLMGRVNPSGKLPDTIPFDVMSIPSSADFGNPDEAVYTEDIYVGYRYFETFAKDAVAYPFGFGLSYTDFTITALGEENLVFRFCVKNTGKVSGREVVQLYCEAPQGKLGKAARVLCGFSKTKLLESGEEEEIEIRVDPYVLASYDDSGATGHRSSYVLEAGSYCFYAGSDVRSAELICRKEKKELEVLSRLSEAMAPCRDFPVIRPVPTEHGYKAELVPVQTRTVDYDRKVQDQLPQARPVTGDLGYRLSDVETGTVSMDDFIAQLSGEELASICRGEGLCSPKVTPGIAGAFGGVTEQLKKYGIPIAGCSDGPSGIRMDCGTRAFAMPNGTLLAATFNLDLCEELFEWEGLELRKNKIDNLLGPGMNIHRNPLNGRNFEYFSEDPFLTGKMAAAQLAGLHTHGVTGTIKHFCCNNQETNRHGVMAHVSERALREIYLKGFEIAVKEGGAYAIMTSYNPVNGYWTSSHYELCTEILRNEWGYNGIVMTDWWAKGNFTGENGSLLNTSAKAQAQNDLFMVNGDASDQSCDNSLESIESGRVSVGCYQRNAANICRYLLRTPAYLRMMHGEDEIDELAKGLIYENEEQFARKIDWFVKERSQISGDELSCMMGDTNLVSTVFPIRGRYQMSIICRASEASPVLAQIPLTIFRDGQVMGVVSLTGADKEWKTFTFENLDPFLMSACLFKLHFSQSGMEIREVSLKLTEDLEERARKELAREE